MKKSNIYSVKLSNSAQDACLHLLPSIKVIRDGMELKRGWRKDSEDYTNRRGYGLLTCPFLVQYLVT